jgi:NAD(P)H-flavin reductase
MTAQGNRADTKEKRSLVCRLAEKRAINQEIVRLDFEWPGPVPGTGQFFLIRPRGSANFLGRPISLALWDAGGKSASGSAARARFLIALRGKGTAELFRMRQGDYAELTGPLGNTWVEFLPEHSGGARIALVGGGIGIAPLFEFAAELCKSAYIVNFYAGFRTWFQRQEEFLSLMGPALMYADKLIAVSEDGKAERTGLIPAFVEPAEYAAVYACGPEPMLRAVAARCRAAGTPCFVSLERRMACGVGACLGCTVETAGGNRRCCTDGPIFPAGDVFW